MSENAVMPLDDYINACDVIREKTGESDLIKSGEMAEKINNVFESGKQAKNEAFWDAYQSQGNRRKYANAFFGSGWDDETYNPIYPIVTSYENANSGDNLFAWAYITDTKVDVIIDLPLSGVANGLFKECKNLVTIRNLDITNYYNYFTKWFLGCYMLQNLTLTGRIYNSGFDVSDCSYLTHDSLMGIINALENHSTASAPYTVTLGSKNLEKLTDAEIVQATEKGWTLL